MSKQSQPSAAPLARRSAAAVAPPAPRRGRRLAGVPALVTVPLVALAAAGCGSGQQVQAQIAPKVVDVALTAPARGTVTSDSRVTVRGTVSPADAVVLVQGRPASVGNGVFVATATIHRGRTRIDVIASAHDATPAATSIAITRPKAHPRPRSIRPVTRTTVVHTAYVPVPARSATTSCGDGLAVGPNTTCPFAQNVRAAYAAHGAGTVVAYSPVTGADYAMSCSAGTSVVCTGGNDASVFFDGPAGATTYTSSAPVYSSGDGSSCGSGLTVGPNTTCAFAANVRAAYDRHGPGAVMAYSPVTRRTYVMTCSRGVSVVCTGGNHASVYFG